MTETMVQDKRGGVYVLPKDYDEGEFEVSEEQLIFEQFANEARDNEQYSKMTVSRVPMNRHGQRGAQKLSFLFEAGIDEYSYSQLLSKLRDEYGSGFYKIQARNDKGQLKLNKTVAVEAPVSDTDKATADSGSGILAQVTQTLATQQTEMREFFRDSNDRPQTDPIDTIVKVAAAVAPILTALGISRPEPAPPPKTLLEQLTEMQMVKDLMGDNSDGPSGEANLYSMLGETMKALGPALASALVNGQSGGDATNPQPTQAALPAPDKIAENPVIDKEAQTMELKTQVGMLLVQAKGGADPKDLAKMIVDNTTPKNEERLWDRISSENCIPEMIALVPEVAERQEWFENLRDEIIEILAEPENTEKEDAAVNHAQEVAGPLNEPPPDEVNEDNENLTGGRTPVQDALSDAVAGVDHSTSEEAPLSDGHNGNPSIDS